MPIDPIEMSKGLRKLATHLSLKMKKTGDKMLYMPDCKKCLAGYLCPGDYDRGCKILEDITMFKEEEIEYYAKRLKELDKVS